MARINEELKEKAKKILTDPEIVKIVVNAQEALRGKISVSKIYDEVFKYVYEKTKDLQKAKELAVSARFLAMLRRDFPEEFKRLVYNEELSKINSESEKSVKIPVFSDIEFELPLGVDINGNPGAELVCRERIVLKDPPQIYTPQYTQRRFFIKFCAPMGSNSRKTAVEFCKEILDALNVTAGSLGSILVRDCLIEILEKQGLKIKVCANCFFEKGENDPAVTGLEARMPCKTETGKPPLRRDGCEAWEPPIKTELIAQNAVKP